MQLHVRRWGSGPRRAALVHGYTDDSETWWQVGPALAACGYEVLAPDLRGHGLSPRGDSYSLEAFAQDLVDTLPAGLDLLVGHSLGALAVHEALPGLQPERTVLVDPPWDPVGVIPRDLSEESVSAVTEAAPLWSAEDVAVDVRSSQRLDPAVTAWLGSLLTGDLEVPTAPSTATLVIPVEGSVMNPRLHPALRDLGYDLVMVPGVGHVVHRDDLQALLDVLCGEVHTAATQV